MQDFFCAGLDITFAGMQETISIGKFVATFGVNGELILKHGLGKKTDLKGLEVLFIEEKSGSKLPHFVASARAKSEEEAFVRLEGILTKEAAQALTHKPVWIKEADFEKLVSKQAAISLLGFMVVENKKPVGVISEVIEQPHQILCTVEVEGKEAYIPLHEESLVKIDRKKREVHVSLPEGLLDIYLQS
jgi:16S rRNA processing protein RimM